MKTALMWLAATTLLGYFAPFSLFAMVPLTLIVIYYQAVRSYRVGVVEEGVRRANRR